LLEGTSAGAGVFTIDLQLITTEEGGDPVGWTFNEFYPSTDADIGTGMVDRKGPGWDRLRVVPGEVGPLQCVLAIGQPVGEGQLVAFTDLGVAGVETRETVALARVALALYDCTGRRFDWGLVRVNGF